uniref:Uncharacterized protein n=1 Tax=Ceratitis capitata TaxID=7213 RepID=W8C888_CERCA
MNVENLFATMVCFMSACENTRNLNKIQINSVISTPLDDVWGFSCREQAKSLSTQLTNLEQLQDDTDALLSSIEESIRDITDKIGINERRNKRAVTNLIDNPSLQMLPSERI